jgi:hypothetical protein
MNRNIVAGTICVLFFVALTTQASADSSGKHSRTYAITITNLTKGQVLTPPVVASHTRRFRLFGVGEAADMPLYTLAETGNPAPLAAQLEDEQSVRDVTVGGGPIPPGHSMTLYVSGNRAASRFTVVTMLAGTNDAFVALQAGRLSIWAASVDAIVYDAGSEENNESCDFVPGPPCSGSGARATEGAEGFIHVSNGVHGIGDLLPEVSDWRGGAARIEVRLAK